jgi:hypothetical protein
MLERHDIAVLRQSAVSCPRSMAGIRTASSHQRRFTYTYAKEDALLIFIDAAKFAAFPLSYFDNANRQITGRLPYYLIKKYHAPDASVALESRRMNR